MAEHKFGRYPFREPPCIEGVAEAVAAEDRHDPRLITAQRVLDEYARIAFFDLSEVVADGRLKPLHTWSREALGAISQFRVTRRPDGTIAAQTIRFWDKIQALDRLAKYMGVFEDNGLEGPQAPPLLEGMTKEEVVTRLLQITAQSDPTTE